MVRFFGKPKITEATQVSQEIQLGDVVRDTITDFEGVCVGITTWLNGCRRVAVQSKELKDGKPIDCVHFDIEQLAIVSSKAHPVLSQTGGPCDAPSRRSDASR